MVSGTWLGRSCQRSPPAPTLITWSHPADRPGWATPSSRAHWATCNSTPSRGGSIRPSFSWGPSPLPGRVHVHTAGDQDPVQRLVDPPEGVQVVVVEGDPHRKSARSAPRRRSTSGSSPTTGGAPLGDPVHGLERLRGDPDEGTPPSVRTVPHSLTPSSVSAMSWATTAFRSPVSAKVASCRSAEDPSSRIRKAYSTSWRFPTRPAHRR